MKQSKVNFSKRYFSPEELSQKLVDQGLTINGENDRALLLNALSRIGYYRLRGYFYFFYEMSDERKPVPIEPKKFRSDINIQDIIDIYYFDEKLRLLILKEIQRVEIAIRTHISEHMSKKYSFHWYMNLAIMSDKYDYNDLINKIKNSKSNTLDHYGERYNHPAYPPSYIITEVLTFGCWSRLYACLLPQDKNSIAKEWGINKSEILEKWLHGTTFLRNLCSHHNRIWYKTTRFEIPTDYKKMADWTAEGVDKSLPYVRLSVLQYLARKSEFDTRYSTFKDDLKQLFTSSPAYLDINKHLGFPPDWEQKQPWA